MLFFFYESNLLIFSIKCCSNVKEPKLLDYDEKSAMASHEILNNLRLIIY